jgi:HAD superfamily phosphatase (TIGR01668 family)
MNSLRTWLSPSQQARSVLDIDLESLRQEGVKGLLLDLDDTLVPADASEPSDEIVAWIARAQEDFHLHLVSNNRSRSRVQDLARTFACPGVHLARKPFDRGFRRALDEMGLVPDQVAVVGDQLFTDVLGGRWLGASTIWVRPLSEERLWYRRWIRFIEDWILPPSLEEEVR